MGRRRYFGTDGIRGRVGESPMTPEFILRLGMAAGRVLDPEGRGRVLIGKDTRISGYMFESALEAGFSAAGVGVRLLGPMPTPAVAYLTKTFRASAGVVISASHNPYHDNGIKFFSPTGDKLSDEIESAIEDALDGSLAMVDSARLGKVSRITDAAGRYIEFCKSTLSGGISLKGMRIAIDCAHGATYHIAPDVLTELGATVVATGVAPDGLNINDGCGSMNPASLQRLVRERGADIGVALDGDGDRVLLVDGDGAVVDGDQILYVLALEFQRAGRLQGPVVGTLMSNLGLERALASHGVGFQRAAVGDRHVMELLRQESGVLGGEPSGHIICLDRTVTGDGIVAALQVLGVMAATGRDLTDLVAGMPRYPQELINVAAPAAHAVEGHPRLQQALAEARKAMGVDGRIVLRPSGTEPLLRVMVEGADPDLVRLYANRLATVAAECADA
ncbi:MAG: phosphoglucosamine mutase [Pseudomonadota bacterium]